MTILSVDLLNDTATETFDQSVQLTYTQTYLVISDDRNENPYNVVNATGIPQPRSRVFIYGTDVYCVSRTPRRVDTDRTAKKWHVEVVFRNNHSSGGAGGAGGFHDNTGTPVFRPNDAVKEVYIDWVEEEVQEDNAILIDIRKDDPFGPSVNVPNWLFNAGSYRQRPVNSSLQPYPITRRVYRQNITVVRHELGWDNTYDDYANTVNDASLTIVEEDQFGTRFDRLFPRGTLRMQPIQKENLWVDGTLYYRVTFPMEYRPEGFRLYLLDEGTARYISQQNINPITDTNYTPAEIASIFGQYVPTGQVEIQSVDAIADPASPAADPQYVSAPLSEPIPLNGSGNPAPVKRYDGTSQDTTWLVYNRYAEKDWTPLNL